MLTNGWTGIQAALVAAKKKDEGFREVPVNGWKLGLQAYSFRRYTLLETIDKAKALGIRYLEAYPGQTIGPNHSDKIGPGAGEKALQAVRDKLESTGVEMALFGVCDLGESEESARPVFEFAQSMGVRILTCEPKREPRFFSLLDTLTREYEVEIAVHNHPEPSQYADPEVPLEALRGHSDRLGVCADVGHWKRSGFDPTESLRLLEGRLTSLHFKDIEEPDDEGKAEDVVFGEGVLDLPRMLFELRRQGFQGIFAIEYERNNEELEESVGQCVDAFLAAAETLGARR